jgi:hypothetical protein
MDWLYDDRTDCWSVLTAIPVKEYLDLMRNAHAERGAIVGQRDVMQTTTAKRIRERMVSDIRQGAVLPPVVVGGVVTNKKFKEYPIKGAKRLADIVSGETAKELAIIDGMQRTAALDQLTKGWIIIE